MSLVASTVSVRRSARTILDGISIEAAPGQVTAVIGPNGAGKSTLLACLAGLLPTSGGGVTLDGVPLERIARRDLARRRAYLPQSPRVDWPLPVARVVALGLTPWLPVFGGLSPDLSAKVDAALAECGLEALAARAATDLSGGELARVMLARAFAGDPQILIVDEPTADLDPRHAIDACRRLRARAGAGAAVVLAIHDVGLALRYADSVVALRGGHLVAQRPRAEVDAALLSALYDVPVSLTSDGVRFLDEA